MTKSAPTVPDNSLAKMVAKPKTHMFPVWLLGACTLGAMVSGLVVAMLLPEPRAIPMPLFVPAAEPPASLENRVEPLTVSPISKVKLVGEVPLDPLTAAPVISFANTLLLVLEEPSDPVHLEGTSAVLLGEDDRFQVAAKPVIGSYGEEVKGRTYRLFTSSGTQCLAAPSSGTYQVGVRAANYEDSRIEDADALWRSMEKRDQHIPFFYAVQLRVIEGDCAAGAVVAWDAEVTSLDWFSREQNIGRKSLRRMNRLIRRSYTKQGFPVSSRPYWDESAFQVQYQGVRYWIVTNNISFDTDGSAEGQALSVDAILIFRSGTNGLPVLDKKLALDYEASFVGC